MLKIEAVDPEKWYTVRQTAKILGWSVDAVRRWVYAGHLQAFIMPGRSGRRKRVFRSARIQGREIIRFVEAHLTVLHPERKLRTHAA
jgi:excisionase family DNA binding protein